MLTRVSINDLSNEMNGPDHRNVRLVEGVRMPAEWEPHDATWIAWPHNRFDWPGKFAPVPWVYCEIVRKLSVHEKVRILVNSGVEEARARRLLAKAGTSSSNVEFFHIPTNRSWARDFGPIYVRRALPEPSLLIAGFCFNAWAKYPDWHLDCEVARKIADATGCAYSPVVFRGKGFVLEGGSIDVNGRGALLTTEECLLAAEVQVRNPDADRADIETVLKEALGTECILWLARGIAGDDTHGHVDDLCRFVGPRTILLCRETNPHDENHRPLEENRERLQGFRLEDGSRPQLAFIPMPTPLFHAGHRLPASYANFYVANGIVLVPTFNDPNDRQALGLIAELFPGRSVIGIHAVDLVWGRGTLHCLTQQQPIAAPNLSSETA
jgi:agmatine deiminase